jgi:hypothetical protein
VFEEKMLESRSAREAVAGLGFGDWARGVVEEKMSESRRAREAAAAGEAMANGGATRRWRWWGLRRDDDEMGEERADPDPDAASEQEARNLSRDL